MQIFKMQRPVLNVVIGEMPVETRPSSFNLYTWQESSMVSATIYFPADADIGKAGDPVEARLLYDDTSHLLFKGEIDFTGAYGKYIYLYLTDGYKKLCDTNIIAAYRKENAAVILQDMLDKAGIGKTAITCPAVELARFSTENICAMVCIKHLIKALEEHGHTGLRFFFDVENTFRFGTIKDSGKNEGPVSEFATGKNIIRKGPGWIEILPLPVRHSQEVIVDGARFIVDRTNMDISGNHSRLRLWLCKEAP